MSVYVYVCVMLQFEHQNANPAPKVRPLQLVLTFSRLIEFFFLFLKLIKYFTLSSHINVGQHQNTHLQMSMSI